MLLNLGKEVNMVILICSECNTEVELEWLDDIAECPNCGAEVKKETCSIAEKGS